MIDAFGLTVAVFLILLMALASDWIGDAVRAWPAWRRRATVRLSHDVEIVGHWLISKLYRVIRRAVNARQRVEHGGQSKTE